MTSTLTAVLLLLQQAAVGGPVSVGDREVLRLERALPPVSAQAAQAQKPTPPAPPAAPKPRGTDGFFFSWGYNSTVFSSQDMHFSQPTLGSDFVLKNVKVHDSEAWDDLFSHSLFVPQYNIRLGYFLNDKWGFELALDHFKWIVTQDQTVQMTGTENGVKVDRPLTLTPDVLRYQLNNGANPVFFNLIRRVELAREPGQTGAVSFLVKAGMGPAVPHTENVLFNKPNEAGFQWFHGWAADIDAGVRLNFYKRLYVEVEDKLIYARYYGVKIDQGTARHSVKANEFAFTFGVAFAR